MHEKNAGEANITTAIPFGLNATAPLFASTDQSDPFRLELRDTNHALILTLRLTPDSEIPDGAAFSVELGRGTVIQPAPASSTLREADRFREQLHQGDTGR